MARACSVCTDERRLRIEQAVVAPGASVRGAASRFGVSASALRRHTRTHLPERVRKAAAAGEILTADRLLREIQHFGKEAARLQARAERGGDVRTAIQALRERTRNVELLARALASAPQPPKAPIRFTVDVSRDDDEEIPSTTTGFPRLLPGPAQAAEEAAPAPAPDVDGGDVDDVALI